MSRLLPLSLILYTPCTQNSSHREATETTWLVGDPNPSCTVPMLDDEIVDMGHAHTPKYIMSIKKRTQHYS